MAEAVVSFTVERLGELLISEANFIYEVKSQIDSIRSQLTRMQCYLQDADAKQHQSHTIRNWLREIRALSYKTEDVIETFVASKRRGGSGTIKTALRKIACLFHNGMTLHKIGLEFMAINAKMNELAINLKTCEQIQTPHGDKSSETLESLRITYSHLTQMDFDFIGMEDEITDLVSRLKIKEKGCEVFSVWGMAGQGKTTLARQVYNHDQIRSSFHAFAWICISQCFRKEKVLQDILVQLIPGKKDEIMAMGDRELVQMLCWVQQENVCLIVLDDIWTLAAWKSIEPAFPIGNQASGSKVLLTTRLWDVAKEGIEYKLRSLSDEESWQLFLKKSFSDKTHDMTEKRIPMEKEKVGREMVRKCEGLPLAICALGGILKHKPTLDDWKLISKDVAPYINRGEQVNVEVHVVTHILALSYDNLSYRLKQLLLYFANFPEDYEIWVWILYRLWIADGLISLDDRKKGETTMDVAERYLVELRNRSLVQVEIGMLGKTWLRFNYCRVHDLIRDLCLLKGKDEDFVNVVDSRDDYSTRLHFNSLTENNATPSRRLAVHLHDGMDRQFLSLYQHNVIRQLRSRLFFNYNRMPLIVDDLRKFRLLRVLSLHNFDLNSGNLVRGVGDLVYLRYLSMRGCMLDELPRSVGNLRLLQTLDLFVDGAISIPNNVLCRMIQLKHLTLPLEFRPKDVSKKLRLYGLREVEQINGFNVRTCELDDLVKLTNVRVLHAVTVTSVEDIAKTMNFISSELHNKQYLSLFCEKISNFSSEEGLSCLVQAFECGALNRLVIHGHVGTLPNHYDPRLFSQRLTVIHLRECGFEEDPMKLLEKVPNLRTLGLYYNFFKGKKMVCGVMGFPQLTVLEISKLTNLETWKVDEGAMPNLAQLTIGYCHQLTMLPDGLRFLDSLRILNLQNMLEEFKNKVKVKNGIQGEDFDKVRHVRSIML